MKIYDIAMLREFYSHYTSRIDSARQVLNRPLTLAEKILFTHADHTESLNGLTRGKDYALFRPDRVAMQDATAQMAILQFINSHRSASAVPATVHCDHLIRACHGATPDLQTACSDNSEVYDFLQSAAERFGFGFWKPGAGIIHQVVLENYAFPGGMMVGTDSHTPNAGGLSMVAVGVGGADAVDVMVGEPWELKLPRIIGVRLTGKLNGWTSAKDVILHLTHRLTTKGATNAIIEYFGPGTATLETTGKATICNMGAEVGATTSVFPFDDQSAAYLRKTGREQVAEWAEQMSDDLRADKEVEEHPERFYDEIIDIDLSSLQPSVNGPFTPDAATPLHDMPVKAQKEGWPLNVEVCLIGSCTNSSYHDMARAASILRQGLDAGLQLKCELIVCPGSELVRLTAERDGMMDIFRQAGAMVTTAACGPCIGQWRRLDGNGNDADPTHRNSIITTFNRNFARRADGNPNTFAFITSPEVAIGYAFTGRLDEHPAFLSSAGTFKPNGLSLPPQGFELKAAAAVAPSHNSTPDASRPLVISPESQRLQLLTPFPTWDGNDFLHLPLLIKTKGKCTTDHISMAGPWLRFRGHLSNISRNLLLGATNAFTDQTGIVSDLTTSNDAQVWEVAEHYREHYGGSIIVADENYGEGSSREHAAMEPRLLGVRAVIARSFARIHETNLKKQGILALTFASPSDYNLIQPCDFITIHCSSFSEGKQLSVEVKHKDGTTSCFPVCHTYNHTQIKWFKAGSALQALTSETNQKE